MNSADCHPALLRRALHILAGEAESPPAGIEEREYFRESFSTLNLALESREASGSERTELARTLELLQTGLSSPVEQDEARSTLRRALSILQAALQGRETESPELEQLEESDLLPELPEGELAEEEDIIPPRTTEVAGETPQVDEVAATEPVEPSRAEAQSPPPPEQPASAARPESGAKSRVAEPGWVSDYLLRNEKAGDFFTELPWAGGERIERISVDPGGGQVPDHVRASGGNAVMAATQQALHAAEKAAAQAGKTKNTTESYVDQPSDQFFKQMPWAGMQ